MNAVKWFRKFGDIEVGWRGWGTRPLLRTVRKNYKLDQGESQKFRGRVMYLVGPFYVVHMLRIKG